MSARRIHYAPGAIVYTTRASFDILPNERLHLHLNLHVVVFLLTARRLEVER